MKVLRVAFKNLISFEKDIVIDLYAKDRVIAGENATLVSEPIYSQNVISFVGINATGKTTVLRLIDMAFKIVIRNYGLDQISYEVRSLINDNSEMIVDFFHDNCFFRLRSVFGYGKGNELIFKQEEVYKYPQSSITSKKKFEALSYDVPALTRDYFNNEENEYIVLKDTDSIVTAFTRDAKCTYSTTLPFTNLNFIYTDGPMNPLFLKVLDKGISEAVVSDRMVKVRFNWKNGLDEVDIMNAEKLLSSGTIKGNTVFSDIVYVLRTGGYMLIDEIENHLNKKLVQLIIDLFQDNYTNRNGATLIFSTHYIEILDTLERKDCIYIMKKEDSGRCGMVKYSEEIKRNDIKKSDVLLSNMIDGTAPSFDDVQAIKEYICRAKDPS